ncbi:hypothetical protein ACSBOB_10455 [Mesorhizobium sp. ASY16-5R]|jgi:hypothetical protein|uniref:hypothetical protein n=1 Tax=Mesorhizobium sp. ASY16-5R TaxID=3445772 RepID=UPI003FA01658
MSAIQIAPHSVPDLRLRPFFASLRNAEPRFYGTTILLLFALAATVFASSVDQRTFLGVDVWMKPQKFEAALVVYLFTLAFFARFLPAGTGERRWYRVYSFVVVVAIVAEMVWIGGAAFLGTASHFNRGPVGGSFYSLMGVGAVILTTPPTVYAWLVARNPATGLSPVVREALVVGLALTLPLTLMTAGTMASMAGHAVGGSGLDSGGFPLMGWVRDGGDLRVAHFFATHSLHVIPLFGLLSLALFGPLNRWPARFFAVLFVGFVMWTFVEALNGRPFLPMIG